MISSNKIKSLSSLKIKKYSDLAGQILVEGKRLISQLIENEIEILEVYYSDENIDLLKKMNCPKYFIKQEILKKFSQTKTPQNIFALINKKTKPIKKNNFLLYLDRIKNPGNLGTIIRTSYSLGIDGIVLSDNSCDVLSEKVIRASLGCVFSLGIEIKDFAWLEKQKAFKIATCLDNKAISLSKLSKISENIILIIGNEDFGICEEILNIADEKVYIPMKNKVESLNIAIASAICCYSILESKNL